MGWQEEDELRKDQLVHDFLSLNNSTGGCDISEQTGRDPLHIRLRVP